MEFIFVAIVGWCGTGWPIRIRGGGGGGGFDPDWPWPPNCWVCDGVMGALGALVINYAVGPHYASAGFLGTVIIAFFGGSFTASLVNSVATKMMSRPRTDG
jgi:hypothetical protein